MIASCALLLLASMQTSVAAPSIDFLDPASGSTVGGNFVTINGSEFGPQQSDILSVTFGGVEVQSFELLTIAEPGTQIGVVTPAHPAGTVDVVVTLTGGVATKTAAFTYVDPPALSGVSPAIGSPAGGETLTIQGSNLATAYSVEFGTCTVDELFGPLCNPSNAATIGSKTDTEILVTAPALAEGSYDLLVATDYGATILANAYSTATATAVSNVTISTSPQTAGQAATVGVTFTSTRALSAGDTITVKLTGYSFPVGTTNVTAGAGLAPGTSLSGTVAAGATDTVVVTVGAGGTVAGSAATLGISATNPAAGTLAKAGLTVATSKDTIPVSSTADIVILPGPRATKLGVIQEVSGCVLGSACSSQPRIAIQDASGATVTSATQSVTLTYLSGTGTLSCSSNPVAAVGGVATFSGCSVNAQTSNLQVQASAPGLTSVNLAPITAVPTPPTLALVASGSVTTLIEDERLPASIRGLPSFVVIEYLRATGTLVFQASANTEAVEFTSSTNESLVGAEDIELETTGSSGTRYEFRYFAKGDANGQATLTFTARNAGGTHSVEVPITVTPVNDAPTATFHRPGADGLGSGITHFSLTPEQASMPLSVPGFLASVSPGPADEAGQSVSVSVVPVACNTSLPTIDMVTGDLYWESPGAGNFGLCLVDIQLRDDGGGNPNCPNLDTNESVEHGSCRSYRLSIVEKEEQIFALLLGQGPNPLFNLVDSKGSAAPPVLAFELTNRGSFLVEGARLQLSAPRGINSPTWTCSAPSGGCTPASGSGAVDALINVDAGESAVIVYSGSYDSSPFLTTRYTLTPPQNLAPGTVILTAPNNVELNPALTTSGVFYGSFEGSDR
ncbi:IPT/TIG domain-containing protein [Pseudomarimonas salicorniae]|uniref:IPT/TIG domain-containing protein n=1 Tax=Pseudomarimonas salicorniae TaxID=2933270 RepID=A0ABT0GGN4_9GAMM|nr:IPT/TIG domain-containing protein [Lysobacter sp. CAU 1642]